MIRLLVLDVDGTMTDGGVYYDSAGNELKKFAPGANVKPCATVPRTCTLTICSRTYTTKPPF